MGLGGSKEAKTGDLDISFLETLNLPLDVKSRLDDQYFLYKNQYEELNGKYERLRVDSEQRQFEFEKRLESSNSQWESSSADSRSQRQQVAQLEQKNNEATAQVSELQVRQDQNDGLLRELETARCGLEVDKAELAKAVNRKDHEIETLNEEWKQMSQRHAEANAARIEALARVEEVETQVVTAQHREQRLAQENGHLHQQNTWLEQEVKEKISELLVLRKDQSERYVELEAQVDQRTEENRRLEEIAERLKVVSDDQNKKIENYCEKLKEARDAQVQQEELHTNQLHSQTKLINLYKVSVSEAEAKVAEMTSAVSELQKLLKEASEANSELEDIRKREADQYKENLEEKETRINQMLKELEHANELIEAARKKGTVHLSEEGIEAMSPSAAAASRLLKSGMTLTQIYSEYVQMSEGLLMEKEENQRLNQYLDQILQEIEERAPVLKKQREDYEKAVESINELTSKLDVAMLECEKVKVASDDNQRRCSHLSRENQRLKQQTTDLGQQVRILLKELEEARGTVVTSDSTEGDVTVAEVSSSSQVISQRLVSFRSIEELQEQNQRLLEAIRDLSDKREQEEKMALDTSTVELKHELDAVSDELEIMKSQRDRQASMVDSIVRQRDMYRVLLSQTTTVQLPAPPPLSPHTSTPMPAAVARSPDVSQTLAQDTSLQMQETKAALIEMQQEFNLYRTEKAGNEKIVTEQLEKFRQDASDLRLQNARLSSQLDFAGERNKILKTNNDSFKKEISALRDKNAQYAASVIRHEQTISTIKQDLIGVQEKMTRAEVICENLRSERNMLKSVEGRLMMEKESMLREQSSQKLLLANLQTIQNNLERSDFERNTQFTQRIEMLDKENAGLKRKLDGIDTQHRSFIKTLEQRIAESQIQYGKERVNHQQNQEKLTKLQEETNDLLQKHAEVTSQLQKAQERLNSNSIGNGENQDETSHMEEEIKDLKMHLSTATTELKGLKAQLEQAKQHAAQYKAIADSIEHNLQEQSQTSKQFKEATEALLNETREAKEQYEQQVEQMEKERQSLINENFRVTENYHKINAELQKQLQAIQSELEEAIQQRKVAVTQEQAARADHVVQAQLAHEAQDKYERELILHAADVEALTTVKQQLGAFNEKLAVVEEEARTATTKLELSKSAWSDQEKMYVEEQTKLRTQIREIQNQNKMLHEEMQALSQQMLNLKQKEQHETQQTAALAECIKTDEENRSSDQLLEVIRFLRKEKEIAEAKSEVAQAESSRLQQRVGYLDHQLDESNRSLSEERQHAQIDALTAAQQVELMRKVDNLNVLQDSNRMLREDRDRLSNQLVEVENRAKKLEEEIRPLQASQHELISVRDTLATEKGTLLAEVQRWRSRTNQLIDQCNKTDPEEHKRLIQERESLRKQVAGVTEENHKHRAEVSRLNVAIAAVQEELATRKAELQKQTVENAQQKSAIEAKDKDADEKMKTINQLRKIGRKYRMQAEEAVKNLETLKEEVEKGSGGKIAALEEKIKTIEKDLELITEKLGSSVVEKNEALQMAKDSENTVKGLREQLSKSTEELKKQKEIEETQGTRIKDVQEQVNKLIEEVKKHKEAETKHLQTRNMVATARTKILSQKETIDKLTAEINELKQKLMALEQSTEEATAQRAAYESRMMTLERELETLRNSQSAPQTDAQRDLEKLQQDYGELQQRVLAMQKMLGSQQKTPQQPGTTKPTISATPVERTGASQSDQARTANIRPMATSAQSRSVPPVRITTAETRAMASIRPMAVAPTPTATVMPTTVSVPEGEMATSTGASSGVRPTPPVQPVSPHIEPDTQVSSEMVEPETVDLIQPVSEPIPSTSSGRDTQAVPPAAKRTRDETEGSEGEQDSGPVKRTKMQEPETEAAAEPDEVLPTVEVLPEATSLPSIAEVVLEQQSSDEASTKEVGVVEPATQGPVQSSGQGSQQASLQAASQAVDTAQEAATAAPQASGSREIIVLDDDEEEIEEEQDDDYDEEEGFREEDAEEGEEDEDEMEGYEEEEVVEEEDDEEGDEVEEVYEEDMQGEDYTEEGEVVVGGMDEEDYNDADAMSEDEEPDEDVVIVDDDEEEPHETPMESQEEPGQTSLQAPGAQVPQVPPRVQLGRIPPRTGSTSRAQQLPPFIMSGQPGAFEEGDDSIVPSTPTLSVPKGSDGFQVAVSSPQVPQGRFLFGAGTSESIGVSPSELAQLESQGAFGMDDTRMDLSQFDDGTGRSGATTPRSRTPPTIAITEAPPQEGEAQSTEAVLDRVAGERITPETSSQGQTQDTVPEGEVPVETTEGATREEDHSDGGTATPGASQPEVKGAEEGQGEVESAAEETEPTEGSDEKPGTSEEKQETGAVRVKRIQRIVWDQTGSSGGPVSAAPQPQQPPQQPPQQRRFARGGQPPRGARPQTAYRGHPMQRMGSAPAGSGYQQQQQQQQQQQGMMRGNPGISRGRTNRGTRGHRRGRPF